VTWLLGLSTKIKLYAVIGCTLVLALVSALLMARSSGSAAQKLKQAQNTLERKRIEYDVAATNAAVDASVRRKRLRQRWERR